MLYRVLTLVYTLKCNARCDICGFSCASDRSEKMNLLDAKRYVREAKDAGLYIVGITGGEPFLYQDEVMELMKYIKELRMSITITSNCFWASTYEQALKIIKKLKKIGVNHMKISSDQFHAMTIPYDNIKNVIEAAKEEGFSLSIGCISLKGADSLKVMLENLKDSIYGITLAEYPCLPVGRAKETFSEDSFYKTDKLSYSCDDRAQLTILPDGKTYPCGSLCGLLENRLVGNARELSIKDLVNKAEMNKTNYFISTLGIKTYYEYIRKNNLDMNLKDKFVNSCDACRELFINNEIDKIEQISEYLDQEDNL